MEPVEPIIIRTAVPLAVPEWVILEPSACEAMIGRLRPITLTRFDGSTEVVGTGIIRDARIIGGAVTVLELDIELGGDISAESLVRIREHLNI